MINVLIAQGILLALLCGALFSQGGGAVLAGLYGGVIAIGNTLLLMRRIRNASRQLHRDSEADVRSLYLGAAERFLFTLVAMAAGMGWLLLHPAFLLIGFGLAYLGHFFGRTDPPAVPISPEKD